MNVKNLIAILSVMPQDAEVGCIWDGGMYSFVHHVWLTQEGRIALVDYDAVVYDDKNRPFGAPSATNEPYWHSGVDPNERNTGKSDDKQCSAQNSN